MIKLINQKNVLESGQVLMITLILMVVVFAMLAGILSYTSVQIVSDRHAILKEQVFNIAEAGIEMAIWKLNNQANYNGETNTSYGNGTYNITITDISGAIKSIKVDSFIPNSSSPKISKTITATTTIGSHIIAFHYGVQSGNGGFLMNGSGTKVNGNVYSNGNIEATIITGSAVAANPSSATADQINDSPTTPSQSITFGNASATEDFAQSFILSESYALNNIQFYIKKVGSPSNATVRILYDDSGLPGTAVNGLTGTLTASQVTSNYGWVSVTMPTTPVLTEGVTYWMVIDASSNASKYYILGANENGYSGGIGKIGKNNGTWNNTSPSGLDGYFKIYLGGITSSITGGTIGETSTDLAWAHTINNVTVSGPLYCEAGSGNNKACDTSLNDPDPQPLPLSDGNIEDWKNEASVGEPIIGDLTISSDTTLGPKKIVGNLSITGGNTLIVSGTIWVTGDIKLTGGSIIRLAESYGDNDGTIVTDGIVELSGGSEFYGSGEEHSYPFVITTSSCPTDVSCGGKDAISFGGGSGTVGLVAQNGTVNISGGSALKAVTAKTIVMGGGAELLYDSGLVNASFSSGSGGAWEFLTGSYVIVK